MKKIFKYIIYSVIVVLIVLLYFLFTPSGNKYTYNFISYIASKKAKVNLDIKSLNIHQYPYVSAEVLVEEQYKVTLEGFVSRSQFDINYTITSDCIQTKSCRINDEIEIKGDINGSSKDFRVTGAGSILEGDINYGFSKQRKTFKDINLTLHNIDSNKLFTLLDEKALFNGNANAKIHFDYIGKKRKKGEIIYDVKDNNFYDLPVSLHVKININDAHHTFLIDFTAPQTTLNISKGHYDQEEKHANAFYTFDSKNLAALESLLGEKYEGSFYALGKIEYHKQIKVEGPSKSFNGMIDFLHNKDRLASLESIIGKKYVGPFYALDKKKYDKKIIIHGLSKSLGGMIDFTYDTNTLAVDLDNISFKTLMKRLNYKPILDANTTGKVIYDFDQKSIAVDTKLKNLKFIQSKITDKIYKQFELNLPEEVFDDSSLEATYEDNILSSNIKIANAKNYLFLKDTTINSAQKSIDTYMDLRTQKYNIKGKVYAKLDEYSTDIDKKDSLQDTQIKFDGIVENHYKLKLNGLFNETWINMDYALSAARLPSHICTIEDDINIKGHLNGPFSRMHVSGRGSMLDGKVSFDGIKIADSLENLTLDMDNIHALKLYTLLGEPDLPYGKANVHAKFEYLSKNTKKGNLTYDLKKSKLFGLPLDLHAQVEIDGASHAFTADMLLINTQINLTKGHYDSDTKITKAFYLLDVKDLTEIETFSGYKYQGPLYAMGEVIYDKELKIEGLSKTFGGMLDFKYDKEKLNINLDDVSFKHLMGLFPYPLLLDGYTTGTINYDFTKKRLLVNTKFDNARFLYSDIVETVYQKSGVNMLRETFTDSSLEARYENSILLGNLKFANNVSHFFLTNTKIDSKKNTVNAYFDFKMQQQEFSGKVYGSLDDPKVNLDMQKLLQFQMNKQLDTFVGEGNSERMINTMPMGDTASDMATGVAGSFMGMFF